jgi:diguanylate cyclase (GGDEF)-like protein
MNNKPVNIITEHDIITFMCSKLSNLVDLRINDLILLLNKNKKLITIKEYESIFIAVNKLESNDIKYLPVVNSDGLLVGILSITDILKRVNYIAMVDQLTKLYTRRYIELVEYKLKNRASVYSVMMLDIDDFKFVNDNYGHDIGDIVLEKLGKIIYNNIRGYDDAIRYGGEEFLIILYRTQLNEAKDVAERIRKKFKAIKYDQNAKLKITVSIGVTISKVKESLDESVRRADYALYLAKKSGKDVVKCA